MDVLDPWYLSLGTSSANNLVNHVTFLNLRPFEPHLKESKVLFIVVYINLFL